MVEQVLWKKTLSHPLYLPLYIQFLYVRLFMEPPEPCIFQSPAGFGGRCPSAYLPSHSSGNVPAPSARDGDGDLWCRYHVRTDYRPSSGRMDHGQLVLALDILHQCPYRNHLNPDDPVFYYRPSLHATNKNED